MNKSRTLPLVAVFRTLIFRYIYPCIRKGKWQIVISCSIGVLGTIFSFTEKRHGGIVLLAFGSYFAFLIGIAAVIIFVNSITVGLLLYYFQSAGAARNYYYDRFRDAVSVFRQYLDFLHDEGLIGPQYNERYHDIEMLTMERLPVGWEDVFLPFLEEVSEDLQAALGSGDEFDSIAGNVEVKAVVLNEAVTGLWVNLMQRVVMRVWLSPVVKSFWILALTISAVIIGAIYFTGITAHILVGFAIGIGCMTILLILDIGFLAVTESREFFDDKSDVDHAQTETQAEASQEETPHAEA